jgi:hypothetical protein
MGFKPESREHKDHSGLIPKAQLDRQPLGLLVFGVALRGRIISLSG